MEDALPRLKECDLGKCRNCSSLGLGKRTRSEIVEFLEKVEQSGKWPQQACTTIFFLIPKNVTSDKPIALMPTLIRWWEAMRAPEVAKWQQKCRVDWDATDGRNGRVQRTTSRKFCGKWKGSNIERKKKIRERWPWIWSWRRHSSGSVSLWSGPGRRTSASRRKILRAVRVL